LKERVDGLDRKLTVIAETANALTDIIDTRRSLRLEVAVVLLIIFEIAITLYPHIDRPSVSTLLGVCLLTLFAELVL
jgi:uncharacterized Rmd1/YagE family protein